ncbi:MAG: RNA-guided pseudouridylation complex pseudouridine synthase subunit Cbf5 [Candidatus Woesearchaeota archaeon]
MLLPFEKNKREIIVKKEFLTSDKFGKDPNNRSVDELINYGIINVNKPKGPTSHQVSYFVQEILNIDKSGHSGTLDPKVTGVLPVALKKATRIVNVLLPSGKEYVCLMHLHKDHEEYEIRKVMDSFVGTIDQLPPIKSAVKRQMRKRTIYYIKIHEIIGKDVLFTVGCQAGTYIRKLVHDIGKKLGSGAHMTQLIRTKAGPFNLKNSWTLQDLKDAYYYYKEENNDKFIKQIILPIEEAINHLPKIWVMDTTVDSLCHGSDLALPGICKFESGINENDNVAILTLKNELICIGTAKMSSDEFKEKKGRAVKTDKVFMDIGIYPKYNK